MTDGSSAVFSRLSPPLRQALSERGFKAPTQPQRRAIPPIVDGNNTLVVAPTGTGKTETAMLPVFDAIIGQGKQEGLSAIYVTPLRALNRDMLDRLEWWGNQLDLEIEVRHGDTGQYRRRQQATNPPDVLITTPETLQAMLTGTRLRAALESVDFVVIDEVHELAGSKRGAQLSVALERLVDLAGNFQRVGLSATVGDPDSVGSFLTGDRPCSIEQLAVGGNLDVSVLFPEPSDADEDLADELLVDPSMACHVRTIDAIVDAHASTLIFVNTRQTAEALGSRFATLEANIGVHHGSLSKRARLDVEDAFKNGDLDGLICTSSMELGIDVGHVDHVVQYGSPRQVTRLLQRVGRAGHTEGATSRGTIVAVDEDDAMEAIVIADRARAGAVEPIAIHEGSLDTVANQIASITFSRDGVDIADVFTCLTRARPFRDLQRSTLDAIIAELANNGVVWHDHDEKCLETTGRTWQYVYDNLSMIPDEVTYEVNDVASGGRQVGTLDERFVVGFAEIGATFIQGGQMWRVVNVDEESVDVTPVEDPTGEIPSWVGEEIPVPHSVAREVGMLRCAVARATQNGFDPAVDDPSTIHTFDCIAKQYAVAPAVLAPASESVLEQAAADTPVPTDKQLVLDSDSETIVLNNCGGHKVNETIGRLVSALLGQQTGSTIGLEVDPYRISLRAPHDVTSRDVESVLLDVDPEHVGPLLEVSLRGSQEVGYRLAHVGKKFGAIESVSAEGPTGSWRRLVRYFEDTPLFDEAVREIFHEDLDPAGAGDLLTDLQRKAIMIKIIQGLEPLSLSSGSTGMELLQPERADASVIDTVRDRLHETEIRLICLHCRGYDRTRTIRSLPSQPRCPECESTRLTAISPWADDLVAALEENSEQTSDREKLYRRASLVQSHGKTAIVALAARGVGPQTAARIINNHRENDRDFYRDILEAERQYARTRSFWD